MRWSQGGIIAFGLIVLSTLFAAPPADSTRIPTSVIELNEHFLDVMGQGYWFIEVSYHHKIKIYKIDSYIQKPFEILNLLVLISSLMKIKSTVLRSLVRTLQEADARLGAGRACAGRQKIPSPGG